MKRLIALPLVAFLFFVVGCDSSSSSGSTTSSAKPTTTASAKSSAKSTPTASANSGDAKGKGDGSGQGKGKGDKTASKRKKLLGQAGTHLETLVNKYPLTALAKEAKPLLEELRGKGVSIKLPQQQRKRSNPGKRPSNKHRTVLRQHRR